MSGEAQPAAPSWGWRAGSKVVMAFTSALCRAFLLGGNHLEVNGLDRFLRLLDERKDIEKRKRGLLTVSNHLSVLDDPIMWGALPLRYSSSPNDMRWSLGSHDIVFKNKSLSTFFALGQVLPTHRLAHSPYGGLFQPTITQAIRLLSAPAPTPSQSPNSPRTTAVPTITTPTDISDPFSDAQLTYALPETPATATTPSNLTYTTDMTDSFPAPSAYATRRHGWVHVYPEGRTHQRVDKTMRYFKWGVSRLILESEPGPALVPVWIEGFDRVMHESRKFPRFVPRAGKDISMTFGEAVDTEVVFGDLRGRWRKLVESEREREREREKQRRVGAAKEHATAIGSELERRDIDAGESQLGELSEGLKYSDEAVRLREECTTRVRQVLLEVRRQRGLPDEDPKAGLVETWREEGGAGKREGRMKDGSWVKDT